MSIEGEETRERPIAGLFIVAAGFLVFAMLIAFLVFENGWRDRYLIATVFLGVLALSGLFEIAKAKPQRFFEIRITTRGQGVVTFASADPDEAHAVCAMLADART